MQAKRAVVKEAEEKVNTHFEYVDLKEESNAQLDSDSDSDSEWIILS